MYKKLFSLAIPNIFSNITVPLVGMADLAIIGMLNSDISLAGIAIGTAIFNMLYWNFGFLRMGTSGLVAQAYGARDLKEGGDIFIRGISVAIIISSLMLILQLPIEYFAMWLMDGSEAVESAAASYFRIRIWAAPANMALYVFNGWFIGMQNSRIPMMTAISINIINISSSFLFAIIFEMGLEGVALGTLLAQWCGVIISASFLLSYYRRVFRGGWFSVDKLRAIFDYKKLVALFKINRDIFLRTVCLVLVFTYFTKASSSMGDSVLAANTLLMQLFTLFSYFMDGFAYAGEALAGRYYGARNLPLLNKAIGVIFKVGTVTALIFSILYMFWGGAILGFFTDSETVLSTAMDSLVWIVAVPIVGYIAFLWDGILVGMTKSEVMRNTMLVSTALFFGFYILLDWLGVDSVLWISFLIYLFSRGFLQWLMTRWDFKNAVKN